MAVADVLVAGRGNVNVAPAGTTLPTSALDDLDAAFANVGLCTTDGVTWREQRQTRRVRFAGQYRTGRTLLIDKQTFVSWAMLDFDELSLTTALAGGTFTFLTDEESVLTPLSDDEDLNEIAVVIDAIDDTTIHRLVIPRAQVVSDMETTWTHEDAAALPVQVEVFADDDTDPWLLYRFIPPAAQVYIFFAEGAPPDEGWTNGDVYVNELTGDIYQFSGGAPAEADSLLRDPLLLRDEPASNAGRPGDVAIDLDNFDLYRRT